MRRDHHQAVSLVSEICPPADGATGQRDVATTRRRHRSAAHLQNGDGLVEVVVLHCRGAVDGGEGTGVLHEESVRLAAVVQVVTHARHVQRQLLHKWDKHNYIYIIHYPVTTQHAML